MTALDIATRRENRKEIDPLLENGERIWEADIMRVALLCSITIHW